MKLEELKRKKSVERQKNYSRTKTKGWPKTREKAENPLNLKLKMVLFHFLSFPISRLQFPTLLRGKSCSNFKRPNRSSFFIPLTIWFFVGHFHSESSQSHECQRLGLTNRMKTVFDEKACSHAHFRGRYRFYPRLQSPFSFRKGDAPTFRHRGKRLFFMLHCMELPLGKFLIESFLFIVRSSQDMPRPRVFATENIL